MGTNRKPSESEKPGDPRVEGIATIGWITLAALGICIPLTGIVGAFAGAAAALVPLSILVGAGLMAMRIWSSGEKQVHLKENEALQGRIRDLEERLANLEMVDSLEAHFAAKHGGRPTLPNGIEGNATMGPVRSETTE
jgi:hypothetical protein